MIEAKVKELREILETRGVSDSGREYRVYSFSSCHVGDDRLQRCLEELFSLIDSTDKED